MAHIGTSFSHFFSILAGQSGREEVKRLQIVELM